MSNVAHLRCGKVTKIIQNHCCERKRHPEILSNAKASLYIAIPSTSFPRSLLSRLNSGKNVWIISMKRCEKRSSSKKTEVPQGQTSGMAVTLGILSFWWMRLGTTNILTGQASIRMLAGKPFRITEFVTIESGHCDWGKYAMITLRLSCEKDVKSWNCIQEKQ